MTSQTVKIRVVNGPNLNLLGSREPEIYGHATMDDVEARCRSALEPYPAEIEFLQSNHEGQLVDWIQQSIGTVQAIVINAAAYTHTSVAILDALKMFDGRIVELHISNPHLREGFRHHSFISPAAHAIIAGLGTSGYELAAKALAVELTGGT